MAAREPCGRQVRDRRSRRIVVLNGSTVTGWGTTKKASSSVARNGRAQAAFSLLFFALRRRPAAETIAVTTGKQARMVVYRWLETLDGNRHAVRSVAPTCAWRPR